VLCSAVLLCVVDVYVYRSEDNRGKFKIKDFEKELGSAVCRSTPSLYSVAALLIHLAVC
jgi:hypothetical protein